jgi:glyoxylase-like metal-dependent hydrolase (beta-lactamase superfamily II)
MAEAGAVIIAHENVRKRLSEETSMEFFNRTAPPKPDEALPKVTFTKELTMHFNGEEVRIIHVQPGHTDGDAVVFLPKSNVIFMGDLYFEGLFPYIGISSGGSIGYMVDSLRRILKLIDEKTVVVPGHGPISSKDDLQAYVEMLARIRDRVARHIQAGRTLEQIQVAEPTKEYNDKWGKGFLPPDRFVNLVYSDLIRFEEK